MIEDNHPVRSSDFLQQVLYFFVISGLDLLLVLKLLLLRNMLHNLKSILIQGIISLMSPNIMNFYLPRNILEIARRIVNVHILMGFLGRIKRLEEIKFRPNGC